MEVRIIDLPRVLDRRGNLSFMESKKHIPFNIERVHWIYDISGSQFYEGHAYRQTKEFIIALSGSFDVLIDNGVDKDVYHLNRSYYGLYVPAGTWLEMNNFSTNSLALVISSTLYDASDYIRDYDEFLKHKLK